MEVEELIIKRNTLQTELTEANKMLIDKFEKETGVNVSSVNLNFISLNNFGSQPKASLININVSLELE